MKLGAWSWVWGAGYWELWVWVLVCEVLPIGNRQLFLLVLQQKSPNKSIIIKAYRERISFLITL
jgi:hypothetical protein